MKRTALVLAIIMALSLLATVSLAAENTMPISTDKITLVFAIPDNFYAANSYADNLPVWQEIEKKTGVTIEWQAVEPSQYDTIMNIRIAANTDMPDVFAVPGSVTNEDLSKQGIALILDDYMEYMPNMMKMYQEHPILEKLSQDSEGRIVAAYIYSTGQYANLRVPIIRKDWLDKLGLEVPSTLDDFYNVLKAFVERDPNGNGMHDEIGMMCNSWKDYYVFITAFGLPSRIGEFFPDENGNLVYTYTREEFRKTVEFINKLYTERLIDPDFVTTTRDIVESTMSKNIVGLGWQAPGVDIRWDGFAKSGGAENPNHIQINPPVDVHGNVSFFTDNPTRRTLAISANTKIPEVAARWVDYVQFSEEGSTMVQWGVEGISYELDSEGKPHLTDWALNNPDGLDVNSAVRSIGAFTPTLPLEPLEFMESKLSGKTVDNLKIIQPNAQDPLILLPLTATEQETVSDVGADLRTYADEMIQKFIIGSEPLSNWDKYVETINNMRLDELQAVYQAQYDRTFGKN